MNELKCKVPSACLTINPDASIAPCCQSSTPYEDEIVHKKYTTHHQYTLENISSLKEFWNSDTVRSVRKRIKDSDEYPRGCSECVKQTRNNERTFYHMYDDTYVWKWDFDEFPEVDDTGRAKKNPSYLEFAASNMCNQTCVTCNSFLSSAWNPLNNKIKKQFPGIEDELGDDISRNWKVYDSRFTDKGLRHIKEILPDLKVLCIKGGEPFADPKNMEMLEYLSKVNPDCYVLINTNFILVEKYIPILKRFKNIDVDASVDGLYEQYEWIRSSKWKKLLQQMDMYSNEIGKPFIVNITVSLYNYFNLNEIIQYWIKNPYCRNFSASNIVHHPSVASFKWLKQEYLDMFYNELEWNHEGLVINRPETFKDKDRNFMFPKIKKWIEVMDKQRGFKLSDSVPEINMLEEMIL